VSIVAHRPQVVSLPTNGESGTAVTALTVSHLDEIVAAAGDRRRCRQAADPDLWFPVLGSRSPSLEREAREQRYAERLCAGCPVIAECLELALRTERGRHGVWGGTSEWQRERVLRARTTRQLVGVAAS
jgi:WhiB family transcriptional regulator, redox-sensing transcriptional regulator